jgi:putative hemolysin
MRLLKWMVNGMSLFTFLFLMLSHTSFAEKKVPSSACPEQTVYSIEGKSQTLCWSAPLEGWVSPACLKKSKSPCEAIGITENAKDAPVKLGEKELQGGKNPGSVLCSKLGGKVVYATLPSGSQITFCEAHDGSLVDCNTIHNLYGERK